MSDSQHSLCTSWQSVTDHSGPEIIAYISSQHTEHSTGSHNSEIN